MKKSKYWIFDSTMDLSFFLGSVIINDCAFKKKKKKSSSFLYRIKGLSSKTYSRIIWEGEVGVRIGQESL